MRVKPVTQLATVLRNVSEDEVRERKLVSVEGYSIENLSHVEFGSLREAKRHNVLSEQDRNAPYISSDLHCVLHQIFNSPSNMQTPSIAVDFLTVNLNTFKEVVDFFNFPQKRPITLIAAHAIQHQALLSNANLPNSKANQPIPSANSGHLDTVQGVRICTDLNLPESLHYISQFVSLAFAEDSVCWHNGELFADPMRILKITHPIRRG